MTSALEIANQALLSVGADAIDDFGDGSTEAKLMAARYEQVKADLLAMYPWNCATRREDLTEDSDTPISGYSHQFLVPDDMLRLLKVWTGDILPTRDMDGERPYSLEGNKLLIDAEAVSIVYIKKIPEDELSTHVQTALIARLAFEVSFGLNASTTSQGMFGQIYEAKLQEARTIDNMGKPPTVLGFNRLNRVRW